MTPTIESQYSLEFFVSHEQQGAYLTLPFQMPPDTESFSLRYFYERHSESEVPVEHGVFTTRVETNIIDLGLVAPDGSQVGASGSDKTAIQVSETGATPGYQPTRLAPGQWQILLGAYKVAPQGVTVRYELAFTPNHRRLLKGDFHTHTLASDGVLALEELAQHARRHGLDFLAITDHNQMVSAASLPKIPGMTLIPGIEWTHYLGHANFLGLDRPYDEPFFTNTPEAALERFKTAHERGALITLNHPFEENYGFLFDLETFPFDCLEIWNGPMRLPNLMAVGFWQGLLEAGKKVPICGGSDYHRDQLFLPLGGPTTCVYALSASPADILAALRQGHAFITFAPNGPTLEMEAGGAIMGDSVRFPEVNEIQVTACGLAAGDVVQVITNLGSTDLVTAPAPGDMRGTFKMEAAGFARVVIARNFLPGLPILPALISNPIYFEA